MKAFPVEDSFPKHCLNRAMLKALFLDLDETLCDTTGANLKARDFLAQRSSSVFKSSFNHTDFANDYLSGIYKVFCEEMKKRFMPITNEENFRTDLLRYLMDKYSISDEISDNTLHSLREEFDEYRMKCFDFFPGVKDLICELKNKYTLIVITNGPIYSQRPKVKKVEIRSLVDHVIIGGEEPEEKPYESIFKKACSLADCKPQEAIHIGDSLSSDIAGAKNAGIKSVWISPELKSDPLPDHTISNFVEIPAVLQQYS